MGFLELFKTSLTAMLKIFLLGFCGFLLVKRHFIDKDGLRFLTKLVIELVLPVFIFSQFIQRFSFAAFGNWLVFPLLSIVIMLAGLGLAILFSRIFRVSGNQHETREFLSLVGFQNSGYLPLILSATLLPRDAAQAMYIYIFLFLLGFNLVIWSFGVWFLRGEPIKKFELGSLFSPPVIATLVSLFIVLIKLDRIMPQFIVGASDMLGQCTLPLAMIIVGGNLGMISITKEANKKAIGAVVLLKLILLPMFAFLILRSFSISGYMGLLIILETAVPSATSLSLIARHYQLEDRLINQGIFFTHIFAIVTIPVFLCLCQMFVF
jgi:hypothetical protein